MLSDLLLALLLVIAAASGLALGLSLLALALRSRRARREPAGSSPPPWRRNDDTERMRRVYFQKERRARALREQERRARERLRQEASWADAAPGDGQATAAPPVVQAERRYRAVLELEGEVTPERVRLAYHRQIAAYHPDKVAGLGAKLQRLAEEETKTINEAYAFFRKRYGF